MHEVKGYIQDLIHKGDVEVERTNSNTSIDKLKIYKYPLPKNNKENILTISFCVL